MSVPVGYHNFSDGTIRHTAGRQNSAADDSDPLPPPPLPVPLAMAQRGSMLPQARRSRLALTLDAESLHSPSMGGGTDPTPSLASPSPLDNPLRYSDAPPTRWTLQQASAGFLPGHRIAGCLRHRRTGADAVVVQQTVTGDGELGARYQNLQLCGSVWVCPVCATRILARRRDELRRALASAKRQRLIPVMMTLTLRHRHGDPLSLLLERMSRAWTRFGKRRPVRRAFAAAGMAGSVRALEVTHGEHGWHPHYHVLLFVKDADLLPAADLLQLWREVVAGVGGTASVRANDIRVGDDEVGRYVTKMTRGVGDELAAATTKDAAGATPWDILRQAAAGSRYHQRLWREYADTMQGRQRLRWSDGLRSLLGIGDEVADEDITDPPLLVIASLKVPADAWRVIVSHELRGELLDIVQRDGIEVAGEWVTRLTDPLEGGKPPGRG